MKTYLKYLFAFALILLFPVNSSYAIGECESTGGSSPQTTKSNSCDGAIIGEASGVSPSGQTFGTYSCPAGSTLTTQTQCGSSTFQTQTFLPGGALFFIPLDDPGSGGGENPPPPTSDTANFYISAIPPTQTISQGDASSQNQLSYLFSITQILPYTPGPYSYYPTNGFQEIYVTYSGCPGSCGFQYAPGWSLPYSSVFSFYNTYDEAFEYAGPHDEQFIIYNKSAIPAGTYTITFTATGTYYPCGGCGGETLTRTATVNLVVNPGPTVLPSADLKVREPYYTPTFTDGPITSYYNGPVELTWTSDSNADFCSISSSPSVGNWTGTSGNATTQGLTANQTIFTLHCSGPGGTKDDTVTVNIPPPPPTYSATCPAPGNKAYLSWTLPSGYSSSHQRAINLGSGATILNVNGQSGLSMEFDTVAGNSYYWWMHTAAPSGAYSDSRSVSFYCTPAAVTAPSISLSPSTFTFGGYSGGPTPPAQNMTITNSGNATLNWKWSRTGSGTWCKLQDNATGVDIPLNTGEALANGASSNVRVVVGPPVGEVPTNNGSINLKDTLPCGISIYDAAANNSPQSATINYNVNSCDLGIVPASNGSASNIISSSYDINWTPFGGIADPTYTRVRVGSDYNEVFNNYPSCFAGTGSCVEYTINWSGVHSSYTVNGGDLNGYNKVVQPNTTYYNRLPAVCNDKKADGSSGGTGHWVDYIFPVTTAGVSTANIYVSVNTSWWNQAWSDGPITIPHGTPVILGWHADNATSCSISSNPYVGGWSGVDNAGVTTVNLTSNQTTFTINCFGPGGSSSDSVVVNIPPKPQNLSRTCNNGGAQTVFNWTPVAGYSQYAVKGNLGTNNYSSPNPPTVNDDPVSGVPPYYFGSTPDQPYTFWVHTKSANGAWSEAATINFTCASATNICDGTWKTIPGSTSLQPVVKYVPASSGSQWKDRMVIGTTNDNSYAISCNFGNLTTSPCTFDSSFTDLGGDTFFPPSLENASNQLNFFVLGTDNNRHRASNNSSGWQGFAYDPGNASWGMPFRDTDGTGRIWQVRRVGSSIQYSCGANLCVGLNFASGSNNAPNPIASNTHFTATCDYGVKGLVDVRASVNGVNCPFKDPPGWTGTTASFDCTSPSSAGTYAVTCSVVSGGGDNVCAQTNAAGTGSGGSGGPGTIIVSNPSATVDIKADGSDGPVNLPNPGSTNITWSYSGATLCTLSPPLGSITSYPNGSGSNSQTGLTSGRPYTISCEPPSPPGNPITDTVQVNVAALPTTLTLQKIGQGTVTSTSEPTQATQINCGISCSTESVQYTAPNTQVNLSASTAASGKIVLGWFGCDSQSIAPDKKSGTCSVDLSGSKEVTVIFAIDPNFKEF